MAGRPKRQKDPVVNYVSMHDLEAMEQRFQKDREKGRKLLENCAKNPVSIIVGRYNHLPYRRISIAKWTNIGHILAH